MILYSFVKQNKEKVDIKLGQRFCFCAFVGITRCAGNRREMVLLGDAGASVVVRSLILNVKSSNSTVMSDVRSTFVDGALTFVDVHLMWHLLLVMWTIVLGKNHV